MGQTYTRENGGLYISWERDRTLRDEEKYSRLYVCADVQNPEDASKMKSMYQEIIEFVEDNNLTDVIGIQFRTLTGFGFYAIAMSKVQDSIEINDLSENYAVYDFAMNKVNELFGLNLE